MPLVNNIFTAAALLAGLGSSCPMAHAAPHSGQQSSQAAGPQFVSSGYFGGHHAMRGAPVSSIPWDKYTDIKYAFAEPTSDCQLNMTGFSPESVGEFVTEAKKHGVKTLLSTGGWTGSIYISSCIGSPENRTTFANTVVDFVKKNGMDGVDIDFEYPNRKGLSCNNISPYDARNLLDFFKEVRAHPDGKNMYLTAAGSLFPWNGPDGAASTDLSGFAEVLDYIMIMAYDLYGAWASTGGPNAAIESTCDKRNIMGAAMDGVSKWMAAGLPANKLVLGIPFYGHGFSVNETSAFTSPGVLNMYPPQNSSDRRQGSSWDNDPPVDPCGDAQPHSGTFQFWSMIEEAGFLDTSGNPKEGIAYTYDECSKTPALYDAKHQWWVSYDNVQSIEAKGAYVRDAGLLGFCAYEIGGDYKGMLIEAARTGAGLK